MKENKKVDTNNITIHYDEGVDEKTTVIRAIEYDGELWYNAADLMKHLKVKTPEELECSRDGLGVTDTDTPIEVSKSGGHFVVFNGHHRLYNAIKDKVKDVLVKVVADEDVTPYGEFLMYYQERRYESGTDSVAP